VGMTDILVPAGLTLPHLDDTLRQFHLRLLC
jgi:hypothetical protein